MAANARGTMRPQSRSPPFLITGLVVALVILGANYWNLSSSNASLSAEVADLQDQMRILTSKKINSERKNENAMLRVRDIEKNINTKEQELAKLKTELSELGASKEACTTKLKQNEDNMSGIQQELATYKDKVQKYENQKSSTVTAQKQDCSEVCKEKQRELFAIMDKFGYYQALQGLSQYGVDILEFKDKISSIQGGEAGQSKSGQQQQQFPQQNQPPRAGGLSVVSPTTQPSKNQTSTKKPGKPATGSIMDVKFGGGLRKSVNQTAEQNKYVNKNLGTLKKITTLSPKEPLSGAGRALSQNSTATGMAKNQGAQLPAPGLIMYNSKNNSIVGDGIKNVLPASKVRVMKDGGSVVEMQEKNKKLTAEKAETPITQYGKSEDKKYDIGEEEDYIDDKAGEKKPQSKSQLEKPDKAGEKQKKTNQDPTGDYEDEDDDETAGNIEKEKTNRELDSIDKLQKKLDTI